ncbi:hypothetical protein PQG02_02910 [Nostoc sp. UHCC 0926]|uniref:hypothetical protein n=1 Tax=unclassified Nostoc TaxID=2593658 RepID=UPI00235F3C8E|nr:hypothetical protein [Nostoc sp. UHCC 0926]WDD33362.1 hypothetical protein PQG02_02910 [Nostoc sp. UHCC 0926]
MSNTSGFSVSKPVALWNKPIKADFKELFKSLSKGVIDGVLGKWEEVAKDAVEATAALGLAAAPEEVAWLLIYRSLVEAIVSLVKTLHCVVKLWVIDRKIPVQYLLLSLKLRRIFLDCLV